jgi:hypothetical protein
MIGNMHRVCTSPYGGRPLLLVGMTMVPDTQTSSRGYEIAGPGPCTADGGTTRAPYLVLGSSRDGAQLGEAG